MLPPGALDAHPPVLSVLSVFPLYSVEGIEKVLVPEVVENGTYADLIGAIGGLLERAREKIATTANTALVETYWNTGRYIVEYEQHGADRAKYGDDLIGRLSKDLTRRYGRGFSKTNVIYMRKLYLTFRKGETLSHFLTWSHYMLILKSADGLEIDFYCKECEHSHWSVRELRRQLKSMLFQRLALSRDKKGVLALARKRNKVDHYDIGQMNMYLNYFRAEEGTKLENAPIGIILGVAKDELQLCMSICACGGRCVLLHYIHSKEKKGT